MFIVVLGIVVQKLVIIRLIRMIDHIRLFNLGIWAIINKLRSKK